MVLKPLSLLSIRGPLRCLTRRWSSQLGRGAAGIWWVGVRDAAQHPIRQTADPQQRLIPPKQSVQGGEILP